VFKISTHTYTRACTHTGDDVCSRVATETPDPARGRLQHPGDTDPAHAWSQERWSDLGGGVWGWYPPVEEPQPSQGPTARQFWRLPGSAAPRCPARGGCRGRASLWGRRGGLCSGCHRDQRLLLPPRAAWQSLRGRAAPWGAFSTPNEVIRLVCEACLRPARSDAPARLEEPGTTLKPGFGGRLGHRQLQDSPSPLGQRRDGRGDAGASRWPLSILSVGAAVI